MCNLYENAVEELEKRYREFHESENRPPNSWIVTDKEGNEKYVRSAIPFVGKEYFSNANGVKVLLYASAENLCGYEDGIEELAEEYRVQRCRQSFDKSVAAGDFFPSVHIQPINDGGLLVVAYQILKKVMGDSFEAIYGNMTPAEFLEHICCSNYGKFTLHKGDGKTNYDYAGDKQVLSFCHDYVRADIEILKPDIIIMPKSMYYKAKQKNEFFSEYHGMIIFPIHQINAGVVHRTIHGNVSKDKSMKIPRYQEIDWNTLTSNEKLWHEKIKAINKDCFKSVYTYVNSVEPDTLR